MAVFAAMRRAAGKARARAGFSFAVLAVLCLGGCISLAMVFNAAGVSSASVESVTPMVYLPGRQGSLQAEMLGRLADAESAAPPALSFL